MRIKIFSIPIVGGEDVEAEMNQFLASHSIAGVSQQLAQGGMGESYWSFCIRYTEGGKKAVAAKGKKKVDYMEVLSPEAFAKFSQLRKFRKEQAKAENVSHYLIFNDAQMADIAKLENPTLAALGKVSGIGDKKLEKYGKQIIEALQSAGNEKSKESDTADS